MLSDIIKATAGLTLALCVGFIWVQSYENAIISYAGLICSCGAYILE